MGEAAMSNELTTDPSGFNWDHLPDEVPADFSGFDDQLPDELPADYGGFDEDCSSDPSALVASPPSTPESSKTLVTDSGYPQLLEPFSPEERGRIMAFAQTLAATVTHVVPKGTRDPVFLRDAPRDWDTYRRQRNDRIFLRGREGRTPKSIYEREEEKKEEGIREQERRKKWLLRQRQIAHGWAKYLYWSERSHQEAQTYREQYEDERGEWLVNVAVSPKFRVRPKSSRPVKFKGTKLAAAPRARGVDSEDES
jgi:hypothetical protein